MTFNFGAKQTSTGGTPGTTGGFSLGGAGGSGFSFGPPKTTTAPSTSSTGGFSFGATGGGLTGAGTSAQVPAASTTGGFSFGAPSSGGTQAATTGGFSLGSASTLGATPSIGGTQAASTGGFPLSGASTLGTAPTAGGTQAASTLFSLGGASSLGAAPSTGGMQAASATGFKLGGAPSLGATSTATTSTAAVGFKLGSSTAAATTAGLGLGGTSTIAGGATASTASAPSSLTSILKPTGTAAPTTKPGLSLTMPTKTTVGLVGTTSTTGLSLGLGAKTAITTAITTTSSTMGAPAASTGPKMSYQQLEQAINKWTVELEEQEKIFLKQATQVNAWDRLLIENGEKITSLHNDMENVKADQQRLEHELDYIVAQQRELEDMLVPLEEAVAAQQQGSIYTQHADLERERTYQLAENTDGQLKRMVQDLKDIIDHLNTANTPLDTNDPMNQIAKILNAHMDSLQWIDQNTVMLQRKVDEVAKQCDIVRRDQERNVHLAFD